MSRIVCLLALATFPLFAQVPQQQDGTAALQSTGRPIRWQNVAVAGGGIAAAAIGLVFIALNPGSHAH